MSSGGLSNGTAGRRNAASEQKLTVVEANGIVKRFGSHVVVQNVNLTCRSGEILLLLGANGAGKSTLLRIVAGLVRADRGSVRMAEGVRVGFSGHYTCLYSRLSIRANLALYASLAGVCGERLCELMQQWRLLDVQHKAVSDVSKGAQSKASLVRALMAEPRVLVLDEPSSNLDEGATELLCSVIRQHAAVGGVSLVATHDVARLVGIATRVVVMDHGSIIADSGADADEATIDSVVEHYRTSNR